MGIRPKIPFSVLSVSFSPCVSLVYEYEYKYKYEYEYEYEFVFVFVRSNTTDLRKLVCSISINWPCNNNGYFRFGIVVSLINEKTKNCLYKPPFSFQPLFLSIILSTETTNTTKIPQINSLSFYSTRNTMKPTTKITSTSAISTQTTQSSTPLSFELYYSFCPKCGVDVSQFSHEDFCPCIRQGNNKS
ncbi:hypothetical protein F4703DRAFT_1979203 [Phycomyces blakesleeanus]